MAVKVLERRKPKRRIGPHTCTAQEREDADGIKHVYPYCSICGRAMKGAPIHTKGVGMAAEENGNGHKPEEQPQAVVPSRVIIDFKEPGAATFDFHVQNVQPAQLAAVAKWLNWHVDRIYTSHADAMDAMHQQALEVPQLIVPPGLFAKH